MVEEIRQKVDFLKPSSKTVEVSGRLSYNDKSRAWSSLRFKTRIFEEFPQLRGKEKISYQMRLYKSSKEFLKEMKRIVKSGEELPTTLRFYKLKH